MSDCVQEAITAYQNAVTASINLMNAEILACTTFECQQQAIARNHDRLVGLEQALIEAIAECHRLNTPPGGES